MMKTFCIMIGLVALTNCAPAIQPTSTANPIEWQWERNHIHLTVPAGASFILEIDFSTKWEQQVSVQSGLYDVQGLTRIKSFNSRTEGAHHRWVYKNEKSVPVKLIVEPLYKEAEWKEELPWKNQENHTIQESGVQRVELGFEFVGERDISDLIVSMSTSSAFKQIK